MAPLAAEGTRHKVGPWASLAILCLALLLSSNARPGATTQCHEGKEIGICQKPALPVNSSRLTAFQGCVIMIVFVLQLRKLRLRDGKFLAQCHTALPTFSRLWSLTKPQMFLTWGGSRVPPSNLAGSLASRVPGTIHGVPG